MTERISLLNVAHNLIANILCPGDVAIDATVGNGHDALFLAQQVGPSGRVFGFDIQQAALDSTLAKFRQIGQQDCLTLIHGSHAEMNDKIPDRFHGHVKAVMFNLGYLPGSDKSVITRTDSTLAALSAAARLLSNGGIITVMAYPGHPGGDTETAQVKNWMQQLDAEQFIVDTIYSAQHKISAPRLFIIRKKPSPTPKL